MSHQIHRITLFKVANQDDVQSIIDKYATMKTDAKKDNKPYILSCTAGPAHQDPRNQGYNLAVETTFSSKEDMDYYDNECEAHGALKAHAKGKVAGPPLMVFFENALEK